MTQNDYNFISFSLHFDLDTLFKKYVSYCLWYSLSNVSEFCKKGDGVSIGGRVFWVCVFRDILSLSQEEWVRYEKWYSIAKSY